MKRISDSELKVFEIVWDNQPITAKNICLIAKDKVNWAINTTYTVVTQMVRKGLLKREEPKFLISATVTREEVQSSEFDYLVKRFFKNSKSTLFSALVDEGKIDKDDIEELRKLIEK